jgi:hypothetical protein
MRKIIGAVALLAIAVSANAQRTLIKATTSGSWQTTAIWSLGRLPANNDSVVIAAGVTVGITGNGTTIALSNVIVDIFGNLAFDEPSGASKTNDLDITTTTSNIAVPVVRIANGASIAKRNAGNGTGRIRIIVNGVTANTQIKYSTGTVSPAPGIGQTAGTTIAGPAFAQNTFNQQPLYFTTGSAASLPLSLTGFRAGINGKNITLNWTSLQEINTQSFVIEKSSNGIGWQSIGSIAAAGSVSVPKNYQFTDTKGADINYYRLKIIDINGSASYSSVLAVKLNDAATNISVFPNPAVNSVNIGVGRIPATHGFTLNIFNPNGQRVTSQQVAAGTNVLSLDISHFASGNYTIDIKFADGTSETRKLMITK